MNKHEQDLYNQALKDMERYYNALLDIKGIVDSKISFADSFPTVRAMIKIQRIIEGVING